MASNEDKRSIRAFVLGGGGARGALQVGALRALFEADVLPDLLVGTSIGAANATYVAARGLSTESLAGLESAWRNAAEIELLPDNYLWLTIRALFRRQGTDTAQRIRAFFQQQGFSSTLKFGDLTGPRLILVAADLRAGGLVLFGTRPDDLVLDGVLASTAIPPWVRPMAQGDHLLMDGGVVSNLPIESAIAQGATEIVALDLDDPRPVGPTVGGFGPFLFQLIHTVEQRQKLLEKQIAEGRGVPVHHVKLETESPVAVWEFSRTESLIDRGYTIMKRYLDEHRELGQPVARDHVAWWRGLWERGKTHR